MIVTATAKRYAKALFELAQEKNHIDQILNEFKSFLRLIEEQADLKLILNLPNYQEREKSLAALLKEGFSELFFNFLRIVLKNKRFDLIYQIFDDLQRRVDSFYHRSRAIVITALPLPEENLFELSRDIASYLNAEVRIENQVDPSILGGLIIQLDGKLFNASLLEQFKKLKYYLIKDQK